MKFKSQLKEIINSKWFLYLISALATINIVVYVINGYINTIFFFLLVALLTYQFQKNIAIVLLVALVVSNLLMTSPIIREGLETIVESNTDTDTNTHKIKKIKRNIKKQLDKAITDGDKNEDENKTTDEIKDEEPSEEITDANNPDMNKQSGDANALEGFDVKKGKTKSGEPEGFRMQKLEGTSNITSKKSTGTYKSGTQKFLNF